MTKNERNLQVKYSNFSFPSFDLLLFSVDDEDIPNEKKSSRNKKLNSQQSTIERRDSSVEDSIVQSTTNDNTYELPTPTTHYEPYTPPIVRLIFLLISNIDLLSILASCICTIEP